MKKVIILALFVFASLPIYAANLDSLFQEAKASMEKKQYEVAVDQFTEVLIADTTHAEAYFERGMSFLFLQKYYEAINDFAFCLTYDSDNIDALNNQGLAMIFVGYPNVAVEKISEAIEKDPKFTEAYINRANAYINMEKYDSALVDLDKANELDPKNPSLYYQYGRLYYVTKDYPKSIDNYTKAMDYGLRNAKMYYNRGNAYFKSDKYELAIKDYNKALEINPQDMDILNNRAVAYEKNGQIELAEKDREVLAKFAGLDLPPLDSLEFKKYQSADGVISIELPANWDFETDVNGEITDMTITLDSYNGMTVTGVTIALVRNMHRQYGTTSEEEVISFWEGSQAKNIADYFDYQFFSQKSMIVGSFWGWLNKTKLQVVKEIEPFKLYELVLVKDDKLFYAYFQAPERLFNYYSKIFDRAVESLEINL